MVVIAPHRRYYWEDSLNRHRVSRVWNTPHLTLQDLKWRRTCVLITVGVRGNNAFSARGLGVSSPLCLSSDNILDC